MFKKYYAIFEDVWQMLFFTTIAALMASILILSIWYTFSTKTFEGYYLRHHADGSYAVMINWENSDDEIAYKTFNGKEAVDMLRELKSIGYK